MTPYEVIAHRVPEDAGKAISDAKIKGVTVTRERWRTYPAADGAAQTIGFVGFSKEDTISGLYGLERYYNDVLDRNAAGLFGNFFLQSCLRISIMSLSMHVLLDRVIS